MLAPRSCQLAIFPATTLMRLSLAMPMRLTRAGTLRPSSTPNYGSMAKSRNKWCLKIAGAGRADRQTKANTFFRNLISYRTNRGPTQNVIHEAINMFALQVLPMFASGAVAVTLTLDSPLVRVARGTRSWRGPCSWRVDGLDSFGHGASQAPRVHGLIPRACWPAPLFSFPLPHSTRLEATVT